MKTPARAASATATCAQAKMEALRHHVLFKITLFTISVAGGYYSSRLLFTGLHQLPSWTASAHAMANPFLEILRMLHSGFSN